MKLKTIGKWILGSTLVAGLIAVAPIVLSSCSFGTKAENTLITNRITKEVVINQPDATLLAKTGTEWQNVYQFGNKQEIIDAFAAINDSELQAIGFDFKNCSVDSVTLEDNTTSANLCNLVVRFYTPSQNIELKVTVDNLLVYALDGLTPPSVEQLNQTFDQVNLASISNLNPDEISDAMWVEAINTYQPNSIPAMLYRLVQRGMINHGSGYNGPEQYQLVFEANPEYKNYISQLPNWSDFKPITITINLSPYLNKKLVTSFSLSSDQTQSYFGPNATIASVQSMSQQQIFEKLSAYVKANDTIQPLRNCLDLNNNLYSFLYLPETVTNGAVIQFSTDPNSSTSQRYVYSFYLSFGNPPVAPSTNASSTIN